MIEVRHHLSRIYVGRDGVPEGAKVTAEVQQVPSHDDGLLAFDTIMTITPRPKRYVLPMPTGDPKETSDSVFVAVHTAIGWHQSEYKYGLTFGMLPEGSIHTQSDIDAAPDWVKAIKPVEVTDDEQ